VITPPLARAGATVTLTFTVDQALVADPIVTLEGTAVTFGVVEDGTSRDDNRYPDGAVSVVATLTSKAGRPGALRLGTLIIDRTPNRVDGAFALAPDSGAVGVGGTATLSFRVLEPVDDVHPPRVFFDDGAETAWTLQQGDGTAFTFASTVANPPVPAEGEYDVRVVLLDNAGNESAPLPAGVIRVDATAPGLIERGITITAAADSGAALRDDDVAAAGPGALLTVSFTRRAPRGHARRRRQL
jgi:hypothetical protein